MKPSRMIMLGIFSFLLFLIINTPAAVIRHVIPQSGTPVIKLGTLDGSLWNGSAGFVRINQHEFTDLNWSLKTWKLLLGTLSLSVDGNYQQGPVNGDVSISANRTLSLNNVNAQLDAKLLGNIVQIPIGELDGVIRIQLRDAVLSESTVPSANGIINWSQASITVAETASLGNVALTLAESADAPLTVRISNQGGDIKLDGNARLTQAGDYKLELNMLPSENASNNIANSLKLFAKSQADGNYLFTNSGNLSQLGLMQ